MEMGMMLLSSNKYLKYRITSAMKLEPSKPLSSSSTNDMITIITNSSLLRKFSYQSSLPNFVEGYFAFIDIFISLPM
mgnify:CR=1 FL=1